MELNWKRFVGLMVVSILVIGIEWFENSSQDTQFTVVRYQTVQMKSKLSEVQKNMSKNLIILRQQVLNDIKQRVLHPNIYSNFTRRKIYESNVDKYLEEINVIEPIRTVSFTCTVYPDIKRKYPDLPYCGPTFTYYRYGIDHSLCSSKHPQLAYIKFCLARDDISVTHMVERHLAKHYEAKTTLFVHVIPYGRVDIIGNVKVGTVIISPKSCADNMNFMNSASFKQVEEVFVISQYFGNAPFHAMIENLPRISLYTEFLKTFVNISIHVGSPAPYITKTLNALGIEQSRLVYGPVVADVVYLPRGGGCGNIREPESHLLTQQYHNYTQKYLRSLKQKNTLAVVNSTNKAPSGTNKTSTGTDTASSSTNTASSGTNKASSGTNTASSGTDTASSSTDTASSSTKMTSGDTNKASSSTNKVYSGTNTRLNIVLLRRSRRRRWLNDNQYKQIEQYLIKISNKHGFHYKCFNDQHIPSFNDTAAMFYSAALVVGAHGAGLSNLIFAQPGAYVIELMCKQDPNLCYGNLSEKQGLHHYILASSGGGCGGMSFNITRFHLLVDYFMERILEKKIVK